MKSRSLKINQFWIVLILIFIAVSNSLGQEAASADDGTAAEAVTQEKINFLSTAWNFVVFEIKGNPVQVGQIIIAIILLSIGVGLSKWLGNKLGEFLARQTHLDENSSSLIKRIVYYILLLVVLLSTLQMIEIPITMFAFLGGAIAIAFGFGAQNIFNNFISGLILLMEKPVRIGDLIELEDRFGHIAEIGARCTKVRRVDGAEILIPNSYLLENNVINRTLSDKRARTEVTVGVAYGSPVREVERLFYEAINEHPHIMKEPAPIVIFNEFGDNSLNFIAYFWVEDERIMELRRVRSDIRYALDEKFNKAGITIAFPQRDVHLDTNKPLQINLIKGNEKQ